MSTAIEMSCSRQEELLREAASRQTVLTLTCRVKEGWTTFQSLFLGFDRSSGDPVVAYPSGPEHMGLDIADGQSIGVSFRRGPRKCVFETQVGGRCFFSTGKSDDVSALRLLWPTSIYELQRRLYYRTPVPGDVHIPVEVWRCEDPSEDSARGPTFSGTMMDVSAGGLSVVLRCGDNPRWSGSTRVGCSFVAPPDGERLQVFGETRYISPSNEEDFRLGIQFVGLETSEAERPVLERILQLTNEFQKIEMRRAARV